MCVLTPSFANLSSVLMSVARLGEKFVGPWKAAQCCCSLVALRSILHQAVKVVM